MNYPLISEYIESIKYAEENFATLTNLRPVLDDEGNPIMSSGNFAVVFKMQDIVTKDLFAVKCFTREQEGRKEAYKKIITALKRVESDYLVNITFLDFELFVNTSNSDESEFPVLIMDWVEGITLDKYIYKYQGNSFVLHDLCVSFNLLCKWLISQNFAHGDIKPDNILVRYDGSLVLVDYDGMFTPKMKGEKAREIGSENYRHPLRTVDDFNKYIDDFSLAAISLSLKAISISYGIIEKIACNEAFIFTKDDYYSIKDSQTFNLLKELAYEEVSLMQYISTFMLAYNKVALSVHNFEFGEVKVSNLLNTRDIFIRNEEPMDSLGVVYSYDGKRVLSFDYDVSEEIDIHIKEGVVCICEGAFSSYKSRKLNLYLPKSLRFFTKNSFSYNYNRLSWDSPWFTYQDGVIYSSDFTSCVMQHLKDVTIDERVKIIERGCFNYLDVTNINLPAKLEIIKENAFKNATTNSHIVFPDSLKIIGEHAFSFVDTIESISFGRDLVALGPLCFNLCKNLSSISFSPDCKLVEISENTFNNCYNLSSIFFPPFLKRIGNEAFQYCYAIDELEFPDTLVTIGEKAFNMNSSMRNDKEVHSKLRTLTIPQGVKSIGERAFSLCESLEQVIIYSDDIALGESVFEGCSSLTTFKALKLKKIATGQFANCVSLTGLICPEVNTIEQNAFENCTELEFEIPVNCMYIEPGAFVGIKSIKPNQNFIYEDDMLMTSDRTKLLLCNSDNNNILIPEGIVEVFGAAFSYVPDYIRLPNSISDNSIERLLYLDVQYVQIPLGRKIEKKWDFRAKSFGSEAVWFDDLGVIYSADKTKLLKFPESILAKTYNVLDGCISIEDEAFEGDEDYDPEGGGTYYSGNKLETLSFPESIKYIGRNALYGCRKLTNLILPNSLEVLCEYALSGCVSIRQLQLPKRLQSFESSALPCHLAIITSLSPFFIVVNNCLLSADNQLLWLPPTITELKLPKEVSYKGKQCFTYPNCIVSMDGSLLWTVPNIEKFEFPENIKSIAKGAFAYNKRIKTIKIPEGVKSIESGAFSCNQSLTAIYLPSTIEEIGDLRTYQGWGRKYIDFFYPDEIHIPKYMKRHFLNLLPGLNDNVLIEDN